jgi:hypothetical protein
MNKLLQIFGSMTPMHNRYLIFYKKHTLAKSSLESIRKTCFGSSLIVSIFNMHARRPIRPHMAICQKSKLVPVASFYSSLPILSSRELYGTRLATNEALLCTCRKRSFHASTSRKRPHTLPFTIETVSMR